MPKNANRTTYRCACLLGVVTTFCINDNVLSQSISLRPVSSTGAHAIVNNEIQIAPGGAIVDIELIVADWSNAPGNPTLHKVGATIVPNGYLGANASPANPGVDLLPVGYALPNPDGGTRSLGFFLVGQVCSLNGRHCGLGSSGEPCAVAEGICILNPRYVVFSCNPIPFSNTEALLYQIDSFCQFSQPGIVDHHDPNRGYFGTLRLVVPPGAVGTYQVDLFADGNFTYIKQPGGIKIPGVTLKSAKITISDFVIPDPALEINKNRYVSFAPTTGGPMTAYRLELITSQLNPAAVGFVGWVGDPASTTGLGYVSPVVATPVFRPWNELAMHVGDCEVLPGAVFHLCATTDGINFDAPLGLSTTATPLNKDWGDVAGAFDGATWSPSNGIANVNDIIAVLSGASGLATAPAATRTNLQAVSSGDSCLNNLVNAADVFMAVLAVSGKPYPFERDPAACAPCP